LTPAPGLYKGQSYYGQGEQILFGQRGQSRVAFPVAPSMSARLEKSCPAHSFKLVVTKCSRMCSIVLYY